MIFIGVLLSMGIAFSAGIGVSCLVEASRMNDEEDEMETEPLIIRNGKPCDNWYQITDIRRMF